tara:strand:- start:118 stop:291 length:174 start_codon:yes stop_codon:yes gene_type:complete
MLKLEANELSIISQCVENATITAKDAKIFIVIIDKIKKEFEKQVEKENISNGSQEKN